MRVSPLHRTLPLALLMAVTASATSAAAVGPGSDDNLPAGVTRLVSVRDGGGHSTRPSTDPSVSADGQLVAFSSRDRHLTSPRTPAGVEQVYIRDLAAGTTRLVSRSADGAAGDRSSDQPALSADGRFLAFTSFATNLVPGQDGSSGQVFLQELATGNTTLVSATSDGEAGDQGSFQPAVSADGGRVAFTTNASNLVRGDRNQKNDVLLYDADSERLTVVSRGPDGRPGDGYSLLPDISADGTLVAYSSTIPDLVPGDENGTNDIFLFDTRSQDTTLVSRSIDGGTGNAASFGAPSIAADGSAVSFGSVASDLVPGSDGTQIYLADTVSGAIQLVSMTPEGEQSDGYAQASAISADGSRVALVVAWTTTTPLNVYVRDVSAATTTLVSQRNGVIGDNNSHAVDISEDGRFVAFDSLSSNLIRNDSNGKSDAFIHRLDLP